MRRAVESPTTVATATNVVISAHPPGKSRSEANSMPLFAREECFLDFSLAGSTLFKTRTGLKVSQVVVKRRQHMRLSHKLTSPL